MPANTEALTTAGSKLSISSASPATVTPTAYGILTYTEIKEITDLGSLGRTYNSVPFQPVATRGTRKLKGSYDDGTTTIQMGYAPGDPGQVLVATALDDDAFYSFKLERQNGSIAFFQAQVLSAPISAGGPDTITSQAVNLSIKSGTIKVKHPA